MLLPLRTGAVPFGTRIELLTDAGELIQKVFPSATWNRWRLLRLDVPAEHGGEILKLRILDEGTWPNQQLRVAQPSWLPAEGTTPAAGPK